MGTLCYLAMDANSIGSDCSATLDYFEDVEYCWVGELVSDSGPCV